MRGMARDRSLTLLTMGVVIAVVLAIVGAGWLAFRLATASDGGCPTALVQGTLVESDGTLAVETEWSPDPVTITWPFGYAVERRDGELVLTRVFGVVARAGDEVSIGGGEGGPGTDFRGCGPIALGLLVPPEEPPPAEGARITIIGAAFEPCIPPPSGCGYAVTLTSPASGTDRAKLKHNRSMESASAGTETPLALEPGLPTRLQPGTYELAFELEEYSDVSSPVVDASGDTTYPPRTWVGCTWSFEVPQDGASHSYTVWVTYRGIECTTEWAVGVAN
jgi:hypothetical protein